MLKGFSLIELMVVIAIIALVAAIAVPAYSNYAMRAKMGAGVAAIDSIVGRMKQYYNTNGFFPNLEDIGYTIDVASDYAPNAILNPETIVDGATTVVVSGGELSVVPCANNQTMALGSVAFIIPDDGLFGSMGYYLYARSDENIIRSFCVNWQSPTGNSDDPEVVYNAYTHCTLPDGNTATVDNFVNFMSSC